MKTKICQPPSTNPNTNINTTKDYEPSKRNNKQKSKTHRKRKKKGKIEEIKILYANAQGLQGKMNSLESAAKTHNSHVITITETQIKPPRIPGYADWYHKPRTNRDGGGVAITVRDDLSHKTQPIDDLEDDNQEVKWIKININNSKKIQIGVYYGKQERDSREDVEREFLQLRTQINQLKKDGQVILTGDFNAKLAINKGEIKQNESPNGKLLRELLENTGMKAISTESQTGTWTRVKQTIRRLERSVIDYILIKEEDTELVTENNIDELGALKLKGRTESDHNTMTISITAPITKDKKTITRWKLGNKEGWKEFNKKIEKEINKDKLDDYTYAESTIIKTL